MSYGDKLIALCKEAKNSVFFAAPFIKIGALKRLVEIIPTETPLVVVTRFLPSDLASGVTDYEIVEFLQLRHETTLFAHPVLHAKLYIIDSIALIGSANLTGRALGWNNLPNLELLLELPSEDSRIQDAQFHIRTTSYLLTKEIAEDVLSASRQLDTKLDISNYETDNLTESINWIPECRRPEILYNVYSTDDDGNATSGAVEAAKRDIEAAHAPKGLNKTTFKSFMRGVLLSSPFYEKLKLASPNGFNDDDAITWLKQEYGEILETPSDTWTTVKEWLKYFDPSGTHIVPLTEFTKITPVIG